MSFGQKVIRSTKIIIPTYNAGEHLDKLLPALARQAVSAEQILVVDSSSSDRTVERFRDFGANIHRIPSAEFDHGGTRQLAVSLCAGADFLIFLTQDAIPAGDDAFIRILNAFDNPQVGMAYGRQLPRPQARAIERHLRLICYPSQPSEIRTLEDRQRLGVKTVFSSNSFAAYRSTALQQVGGFPQKTAFAEDQIVAGKLLMAKLALAYCADAQVVHSHGYTIKQDFERYLEVGAFYARNKWILDTFGPAEGAGRQFIFSELRYVAKNEPWSLPSMIVRTLARYLAYRLGALRSK